MIVEKYYFESNSISEIKAGIEIMAESNTTVYAQIISDKFGITMNKAGNYLRDLVRDGTLEKVKGRVMLGARSHQMYKLADEYAPSQRVMEMIVVRRDPLVEALFGPA